MRRQLSALLLAASAATGASAEVPVREAFQLHCSGCHGPEGRGDGRMVPDLRRLAPLLEVEGGREYLVRVPGVAQAPLESPALARLLDFVLRELSGVEDHEAFDAAEVDRWRRRPLLDPVGARPLPRSTPPAISR
jgi:mono/diheme cytochrome c family protein